MQAIYLYVNCALYVLFAVWCTLAPQATSRNIGFLELNAGGRSEYLAVYGGLQLGLALVFLLLAQGSERQRLGILLSLALYAPIVLYRSTSLVKLWPVPRLTLMTAALECILLLWAALLYWRSTRSG